MVVDSVINMNAIKKSLSELNRVILPLDYIYEAVSKVIDIPSKELKSVSYDVFYEIVKALVDDGYIRNYGKEINNRGYKSLYKKYKLLDVNSEKEMLSEEDKIFLHSLNKKINTDIYFKNEEMLKEDREKLIILNDFLNNVTSDTPYMAINERSYELFGYEKELTGYKEKDLNGKRRYIGLLSRVKVSLESLHCYEKVNPLQCCMGPGFYSKVSRNILIIENQDTYISFVRALFDTGLWSYLDMIVYGEGNAITGNFKNYSFYSISDKDNIYYFGDIDPEGLSIFKRMKKIYKDLNIKLEKKLYRLAIDIAMKKGIRDINNENQRLPEMDEIDDLLSDLDKDVAISFKEIILGGKYVPQEAVNYKVLVGEIKQEILR